MTAIAVGFACPPLYAEDLGAHAMGLQTDGESRTSSSSPLCTEYASPVLAETPQHTPTPTVIPTLNQVPTSAKSNSTNVFAQETIGAENSTLRPPNTITVCNFTTPADTGNIIQISIYLIGEPTGSNVGAVIYANDPDSQLPLDQQLLAQSTEDLNVTSITGEWYNFTTNFAASRNTTYWFGYYSDRCTRYYYDIDPDHISGTSANSTLPNRFPNLFCYINSTIMSLYVVYTHADPKLTSSPSQTSPPETQIPQNYSSPNTQIAQDSGSQTRVAQNSTGEIDLVIIILAEAAVTVFYYRYEKKRANYSSNS